MGWKRIVPLGILLSGTLVAAAFGGGGQDRHMAKCHGKKATIVGTPGDDVLIGTRGQDIFQGGPGNDTIYGWRGNDLICGGGGADLLDGGRNNDVVDGGPGDGDRAYGGLGDDRVDGGRGDGDEVAGHLGIDRVTGGPGDHDYVHGDYGWDRMDGGPGHGDIAAFPTARHAGVRASLKAGKARGDGRDRLFRFEGLDGSARGDVLVGNRKANRISGGAGNDRIRGGAGSDKIFGDQGSDRCRGGAAYTSCGKERAPRASAYVEIDPVPAGGGGLAIVGGRGKDRFRIGFDSASSTFFVSAAKGLALGPGCYRVTAGPRSAHCTAGGPARWLLADLGPGKDRLTVRGDLSPVGQVRIWGGAGNDRIKGGPEADLIESGPGADRVFGRGGSDALVGGLPGPTILNGGAAGDLIAAGGGCAGGAAIGGRGRDNASFAETAAHPGRLIISMPKGKAWIDAVKRCDPVRIDHSIEDIEGSFDNDVLVGDRRGNSMLGQPGQDIFIGGGGRDRINALDKVVDLVINCGRPGRRNRRSPARAKGVARLDRNDPKPSNCARRKGGKSTPGLHHGH